MQKNLLKIRKNRNFPVFAMLIFLNSIQSSLIGTHNKILHRLLEDHHHFFELHTFFTRNLHFSTVNLKFIKLRSKTRSGVISPFFSFEWRHKKIPQQKYKIFEKENGRCRTPKFFAWVFSLFWLFRN